jgi:2-amino-4-hydroxy-6-hydroxymethyldihydropteridine diphosphokinase
MPLQRRLSQKLTLYKDKRFPWCASSQSSLPYKTVIGIGGNIGDVKRRFHHLFFYLKKVKGIDVRATGPILKNPPFGYLEQDDFYNTVIAISTSMQPGVFLRFLLRLEKRFGRRRTFANAPRTLDLDILFFDGRVIRQPGLVVPHPHWNERQSVVIPLQGIARCPNI